MAKTGFTISSLQGDFTPSLVDNNQSITCEATPDGSILVNGQEVTPEQALQIDFSKVIMSPNFDNKKELKWYDVEKRLQEERKRPSFSEEMRIRTTDHANDALAYVRGYGETIRSAEQESEQIITEELPIICPQCSKASTIELIDEFGMCSKCIKKELAKRKRKVKKHKKDDSGKLFRREVR